MSRADFSQLLLDERKLACLPVYGYDRSLALAQRGLERIRQRQHERELAADLDDDGVVFAGETRIVREISEAREL